MLSDDDIKSLDVLRGEPDLSESLNLATMNDPDKAAESLGMPISNETYQANKPQIDRSKKLDLINIESLKKLHPKTSSWLTDKTNASIAIDDLDILKGMEDTTTAHDRTWGEFGIDTSVDLGKGVVGLGQSIVGLLDIVTINRFGHAAEILGYEPEKTKKFLSKFYSEERKEADIKVAKAKGFFGTLEALAEEPETALGTIVESTPMMIGAAAAVKKVASEMLLSAGVEAGTPAATKLLTSADAIAKLTVASSASEGAMVAGQIQETARGKGKEYTESILPATIAGLTTTLIGLLSSKLIPDAEVSLVLASLGSGAKKEFLAAGKEIAKTTFKEGVLEELPQSAQEQIFTNLALGKPWSDGVPEGSAMGLVAGTGTGFGMSVGTQTLTLINSTERDANVAVKSNADQKEIDTIVSFAQSSTTNERSTEHFEDFVNSLGEDKEVLIPNEVAEQMVDAPDYITDQLNDLGISISIPLKKFAGEVALNEEWMGLIRPHIKLSSNTLSQTEIDDADRGEIQELLKRAKVEQETITEADRIFDTVKDQLKETKMQGESTARHSAALYPAYAAVYVEKARKAGHDITMSEAFEMMGFSVQAGDVDVEVAGTILDQPADEDVLAQQDIPDDLEITMESEAIETGDVTEATYNAKELSTEIDDKLDSYQKLLDCLQ